MLISISDFARDHGVNSNRIYGWLKNHKEFREMLVKKGKKKLIEKDGELYQILENQYPMPKSSVEIIGLNPEEERILRKKLEETQEQVIQTQEQVVQLQNDLMVQKRSNKEVEEYRKVLEQRYEEDIRWLRNQIQELSVELDKERKKHEVKYEKDFKSVINDLEAEGVVLTADQTEFIKQCLQSKIDRVTFIKNMVKLS